MPRAPSKSAGVIVRDAHLQIDLRPQGFGKERPDLQPTPANIAHAARMRLEILGKIERGSFSLAEYFPDSPRVQSDVQSMTNRRSPRFAPSASALRWARPATRCPGCRTWSGAAARKWMPSLAMRPTAPAS